MATELIKIDVVKNILSSFPEIIGRNTNSVKKCNEAGQTLLDTIEGEKKERTLSKICVIGLRRSSIFLIVTLTFFK